MPVDSSRDSEPLRPFIEEKLVDSGDEPIPPSTENESADPSTENWSAKDSNAINPVQDTNIPFFIQVQNLQVNGPAHPAALTGQSCSFTRRHTESDFITDDMRNTWDAIGRKYPGSPTYQHFISHIFAAPHIDWFQIKDGYLLEFDVQKVKTEISLMKTLIDDLSATGDRTERNKCFLPMTTLDHWARCHAPMYMAPTQDEKEHWRFGEWVCYIIAVTVQNLLQSSGASPISGMDDAGRIGWAMYVLGVGLK